MKLKVIIHSSGYFYDLKWSLRSLWQVGIVLFLYNSPWEKFTWTGSLFLIWGSWFRFSLWGENLEFCGTVYVEQPLALPGSAKEEKTKLCHDTWSIQETATNVSHTNLTGMSSYLNWISSFSSSPIMTEALFHWLVWSVQTNDRELSHSSWLDKATAKLTVALLGVQISDCSLPPLKMGVECLHETLF